MKTLLLPVVFLSGLFSGVQAQNTDLPGPAANLQTLPSGSYIIAMDNTNQLNSSSLFNLKAYGSVVYLLNNNVKVKWVITAGKAKDGIDLTVSSDQIKPTLNATATSRAFKAGPFVIFAADTTGVGALMDAFYSANTLTGNNRPNVYRTKAAVTVDVRYDLTGFKPSAAILTDGGNEGIHLAFMTTASIPPVNYTTISGLSLLSHCYSFASEPHNSKTGTSTNSVISNIRTFVSQNGNFLAMCAAVPNYENNSAGRFQTTSGITVTNTHIGTTVSYPNPDLSFSQFEGVFNGSLTGSVENWQISGAANNENDHVTGTGSNTSSIAASTAKLTSGQGGMVFYLGNHNFNTSDEQNTNGIRMYMNAFMTPAYQVCPIVLSLALTSFTGNEMNGRSQLQWTVQQNQNADHSNIQKSTDGGNFTTISQVAAAQSGGLLSYSFTDPEALTGTAYYRLEIVDRNNSKSYSDIISLSNNQPVNTGKITILPNPLSTTLNFNYMASAAGENEISIYTVSGTAVLTMKRAVQKGNNLISFPLKGNMPGGVYLLEIVNGGERITTKFIKRQ